MALLKSKWTAVSEKNGNASQNVDHSSILAQVSLQTKDDNHVDVTQETSFITDSTPCEVQKSHHALEQRTHMNCTEFCIDNENVIT